MMQAFGGGGGAAEGGNRCMNVKCVVYKESGFSEVRNGETYCTGCGSLIASADRLEQNTIGFDGNSRMIGRIIHNGEIHGLGDNGNASEIRLLRSLERVQ